MTFNMREDVGQSGEIDLYRNPERDQEYILINYATLPIAYWEIIKLFLRNKNMEVYLSLDPENLTDDTLIITANGGESTGSPVIDITTTKSIPGGAIIDIGSLRYHVLYSMPLSGITTALVLDRVLEEAVANGQSLSVSYPESVGVYKLSVAQIQYEYLGEEFVRNIQLKFIRKAL
jgi:hypothetical protein